MELSKLVVDTKETKVTFPDSEFEIDVVYLSRKESKKLTDDCTTKRMDYKTRQVVETFDEDEFIHRYVQAAIKGWTGLDGKLLKKLMLIDDDVPDDQEIPYSSENAEILVKNSVYFDNWLTEVVNDIKTFQR